MPPAELRAYRNGFMMALTLYAQKLGQSALKSNNPILAELADHMPLPEECKGQPDGMPLAPRTWEPQLPTIEVPEVGAPKIIETVSGACLISRVRNKKTEYYRNGEWVGYSKAYVFLRAAAESILKQLTLDLANTSRPDHVESTVTPSDFGTDGSTQAGGNEFRQVDDPAGHPIMPEFPFGENRNK